MESRDRRGADRAPALPIRILESWSAACNRVVRLLLVALSAVMVVTILLQVFLRYVLKSSLPWSEELSRYLMVWIGLMGASLALHEGRHVGVTFLMERTPALPRRILTGLAFAVVGWFLWLMFAEGIRLLGNIWQQRSPAMNLPMVIPYAAIPLGAIFMMVQLLLAAARLLTGRGPEREG
ncbi:MAG: TRAP transporter small permease [Candidatus Methylomirabilota bacterium]